MSDQLRIPGILREAVIDDGFMAEAPPAIPYELHGETKDGIGQLQSDIVSWTWDGGVWWMTGSDGSITGYQFDHFFWLSLRKMGS